MKDKKYQSLHLHEIAVDVTKRILNELEVSEKDREYGNLRCELQYHIYMAIKNSVRNY
jgi:hypothetical protein